MAQWVRAQGVASAVWPGRSLRASCQWRSARIVLAASWTPLHTSPERERRDTGWLGETASAWGAGSGCDPESPGSRRGLVWGGQSPCRTGLASCPSLTRCCLRFPVSAALASNAGSMTRATPCPPCWCARPMDSSLGGGSRRSLDIFAPCERGLAVVGRGEKISATEAFGPQAARHRTTCWRAYETARRGHDAPAGVQWRRRESNPRPVMFRPERLRVYPVNLSLVRASPAGRVRHEPARNLFSRGRTRR
jgi:hypothetical protein